MEISTKLEKTAIENRESATSKESLYRTMWLMAHNRLHKIVHDSSVSVTAEWQSYLKELESSETAAKIPA